MPSKQLMRAYFSDNADGGTESVKIPESLNKNDDPNRARTTFLLLPVEIRQAFWKALVGFNDQKRHGEWFVKPTVEFLALMLTCKQLYREVKGFRPDNLITFNGFPKFIVALVRDLRHTNMRRYRSMTIQFNLNASSDAFKRLAQVLHYCRSTTEELHLSFTGVDAYATTAYVHGCAHAHSSGRLTKLPPDGQLREEMIRIQYVLMQMTKLRILVVSNMNFQLFQAAFKHKPQLQYLHITADPRSAVHNHFDVLSLGILASTPTEFFPPVKVLNVAANTMLNAFAFPSNCAQTLEHLTWTIPDASLGSNMVGANLFQNTLQLINNLAQNATKLRTLRICVQGSGVQGHTQQYSDLEYALSHAMTRIVSLQDLELHVATTSSHFGYEVLQTLPPGIERFYTTDQLVLPRELYRFITEKYLSATLAPPQVQGRTGLVDYVDQRLARWSPACPYGDPEEDRCPEHCPGIKCFEQPNIYFRIGGGWSNTEFIHASQEQASVKIKFTHVCKRNSFALLYLPGIIGEDLRRKDYIPLTSGDLKFVSYEFENPDYKCRTQGVGETMTQMVLRLNGRLLDRERNRHLSIFNPCATIPPNTEALPIEQSETAISSEYNRIAPHLNPTRWNDMTRLRQHQAASAELKASPLTDDKRYFGNEVEAYWVFQRETVAKVEDLPPMSYPYIEDCYEKDDKCHWMCADAYVPTLAEIDAMKST